MKDVQINATFINLDSAFYDEDFERQLARELEKVKDEIMAHRNSVIEFNAQTLK